MRSYGITNAAPWATAPPVGLAGDTYFNTTSKTMFLSDGTQWIQVQGGSSTANYWISRLVANSAISNTIEGTLPISAATMAAGFTLGAGGANIVCQVAGKYAASLVLMTNTSTASSGPFWVGIQHYRGATGIISWDNIGLAAVNGYPYNQVVATGEFDMQVGDTLGCVAQAPATTYTVGAQSTFMVWPMGGPKGDKGDTGLTGGTAPTVGARIRRNVDQGIVNGGLANIVFNVIETEVVGALGGTFYDGNTGGLKIPPGRAGVYAIWSHCRWEANSSIGFWSVLVNNVMIARDSPGVGAAYLEQNVATTRYLNDGDSITVTAYNASGATRNVSALPSASSTDPAGPILEIWRIDGSQGPPGPTGPVGPDVTLVQSAYWHGVNTGPGGTLGNDVQSPVAWSTLRSNNFTLAQAATRITATLAGKYKITATLNYSGGGQSATFSRCVIYQYNSANTLITSEGTIGNGVASGSSYMEVVGDGIFDMAAGDYLVVNGAVGGSTPAGAFNLGYCYCTVTPVGGTKGDIGPSGGPVPTGGTANQIIVKQSATDFAVAWTDQPGIVAYKYGTIAGYSITTSLIGLINMAGVPLKTSRLYRMTFKARAVVTGGNNIRFQATGMSSNLNMLLDDYAYFPAAYGNIFLSAIVTVSVDSPSHALGVGVSAPANGVASIWTDGGGYMMVEDIGAYKAAQ